MPLVCRAAVIYSSVLRAGRVDAGLLYLGCEPTDLPPYLPHGPRLIERDPHEPGQRTDVPQPVAAIGTTRVDNDADMTFAGEGHPALLGAKVREGWAEIADFNDNVMKVGLAGDVLAYRDQEMTLTIGGKPRRVWLDLDYSPSAAMPSAWTSTMACSCPRSGTPPLTAAS